jgi:hypothetical protein
MAALPQSPGNARGLCGLRQKRGSYVMVLSNTGKAALQKAALQKGSNDARPDKRDTTAMNILRLAETKELRITIKPVYRFHRNNHLCEQPVCQDTGTTRIKSSNRRRLALGVARQCTTGGPLCPVRINAARSLSFSEQLRVSAWCRSLEPK